MSGLQDLAILLLLLLLIIIIIIFIFFRWAGHVARIEGRRDF